MTNDELHKQINELKAEINRVDDWANGIFTLLVQILPLLLKEHPDVMAKVVPMLRSDDVDYQKACQGLPTEQTLEFLEARAKFYQILSLLTGDATDRR